jgi:hypothetical protein
LFLFVPNPRISPFSSISAASANLMGLIASIATCDVLFGVHPEDSLLQPQTAPTLIHQFHSIVDRLDIAEMFPIMQPLNVLEAIGSSSPALTMRGRR